MENTTKTTPKKMTDERAMQIIEEIGLNANMTKSEAKRLIQALNYHCCISCFTRFLTKRQLVEHLRRSRRHRVNPAKIKREYNELHERRHEPKWQKAYLIAFLKVILLKRLL